MGVVIPLPQPTRPSLRDVVNRLKQIVEEMENIPLNDAVYKSTSRVLGQGRVSDLALRHLKMKKSEYLNWRANFPAVHDSDPEVKDIRQRFAKVVREFVDLQIA